MVRELERELQRERLLKEAMSEKWALVELKEVYKRSEHHNICCGCRTMSDANVGTLSRIWANRTSRSVPKERSWHRPDPLSHSKKKWRTFWESKSFWHKTRRNSWNLRWLSDVYHQTTFYQLLQSILPAPQNETWKFKKIKKGGGLSFHSATFCQTL